MFANPEGKVQARQDLGRARDRNTSLELGTGFRWMRMTSTTVPELPPPSSPSSAPRPTSHFDIIVIGAGPAGHRAAVQASKLGAKVAVVERGKTVGGACVTTGTLPSKTLHENVRYNAGMKHRSLSTRGVGAVTMALLLDRKTQVISHEVELRASQLARNHIPVLAGSARFLSSTRIEVCSLDGIRAEYTADKFVIATGSKPSRPSFWNPSLNDPRILDSDSVLELDTIPKTLTVLGAGVIGCEYAHDFCRPLHRGDVDRPSRSVDALYGFRDRRHVGVQHAQGRHHPQTRRGARRHSL